MFPLRDENPAARRPLVTAGLAMVCAAVFLWQGLAGEEAARRALYALGTIPAVVLDHAELARDLVRVPPWVTLFTSMFLHGGMLHLGGNLLFLWVFGRNVEDAMGHGRFLVFYLACGVLAALVHVLADPLSAIPMIGASGAVSGVLGAYLLLYPRARILVVVPLGFFPYTLYLPAASVLGFWFLAQVVSALLAAEGDDGVAWVAHLGGFVAGMVLVPLFRRRGVRLWAPRR